MDEGWPYRVDVCYKVPILCTPTSCRIWKNIINTRHSTYPIATVTICLMIFKARMNVLFILKVKTTMLVQCSCMSPRSMLTIVNTIFFACNSTSFRHVSCLCPFLDLRLTTYHPNAKIFVVLELGTSTLAPLIPSNRNQPLPYQGLTF
jgi:hypothetical protein